MAKQVPEGTVQFYQIQELWSYPWSDWFNGGVWILTHGEDFQSPSVANFRNQVKYVARVRDVAVRTRISGNTLAIQAYEIPD